jgi:hypothetical protein
VSAREAGDTNHMPPPSCSICDRLVKSGQGHFAEMLDQLAMQRPNVERSKKDPPKRV